MPSSSWGLARWLSIVGIGEAGIDELSPAACRLLEAAELVVGGARHLELAKPLIKGRQLAWPSPLTEAFPAIVAMRGRAVAVLASGDPFHFGVGSTLLRETGISAAEMLTLPAPSAFALSAAHMGWAQQDAILLSVHGRAHEAVVPHLHHGARILALSWDAASPRRIADILAARGMGRSRVTVLEALGGPHERIRSVAAGDFALDHIADLNTLAIEVVADAGARIVPFAAGLDDTCFESDGTMTKRDVRAITISSLGPRHGERLWDVGAGSGSVAIEWLLRHASLTATAIEPRADRIALIARNAANLGVPRLDTIEGLAPAALATLPRPNAIFIGGGASVAGVIEACWQALPAGGRLVANAVTLQSERAMLDAQSRLGGELLRIAISRAEPVGSMTGWRPAMPVTHWRAVKP